MKWFILILIFIILLLISYFVCAMKLAKEEDVFLEKTLKYVK